MHPNRALNNLTRQEWNAAYFLGLERVFRRNHPHSFADQMAAGLQCLVQAGYPIRGASSDGDSRALSGATTGEHEKSCEEITRGAFDPIDRARDALPWIAANLPEMNTEWLQALLSLYDTTHPTAHGRADRAGPRLEPRLAPRSSSRPSGAHPI